MDFLTRSSAAILRAFRYTTGMGLPDVRPVFISIPKTGSTSVARMLRSAYWGQPVLYLPIDGDDRERILRMPARLFNRFGVYRGFFDTTIARKRVPNPFIFTFLRNPEERLVSDLYYGPAKTGGRFSFEGWSPGDCNVMTRMLAGNGSAEAAIEVLSSMDFVGVTERIGSDMQRLLARLGRPNVPVVAKNVNRGRPAMDDLPPRIRSLLAEATEADRKIYEWALTRV
jgi:Sulfotransferase family